MGMKNQTDMEKTKAMQEQFRTYRDTLYRPFPRVARFEGIKRKWLGGLMLLCVVYHAVGLCRVSAMYGGISGYDMLRQITDIGMDLIFLLAVMGPKWKLAWVLYLLGAYRLTDLVRAGMLKPGALAGVFTDGLGQDPLAAVVVAGMLLYVVLVLAAALWLTLVPGNRELAEQSEKLNLELKAFMEQHTVK